MANFNQDWNPVVLRKSKGAGGPATSGALVTEAQKTAAMRTGVAVETQHKYGAGGNQKAVTTLDKRKIEEETEDFTIKRVDASLSKRIMQARMNAKMSQKDLAQKINEKPSVVADYEAGRAIPNQQVIGKIERALGGAKLRGGAAKGGKAAGKK